MIEPRRRKSIQRAVSWVGFVVLSGALGWAQPAAKDALRSDGQIEMDVVQALDASKALKDDMLQAATVKGAVTLSGTVSTEASKELAEAIVRRVPGVVAVNNKLRVGRVTESAAAMPPAPPEEPPLASEPPAPPEVGDGPTLPPQAYAREQAPSPGDLGGQDGGTSVAPRRMIYVRPGTPGAVAAPGAGLPPSVGPEQVTQAASGPVTIAAGTLLQMRTDEPLTSRFAQSGQPVHFTVIRDVLAVGRLAIPRGAAVHGEVVDARPSGAVKGNAELALRLVSIDLGGRNYPLESDLFKVVGPGKGGQTVGNAVAAGLVGTLLGCAIGGGKGCAIGAGAGVAAGTAASAASKGPAAWIPAEALVDLHLTVPLTVEPVSQQEALRLSQGLNAASGPTLNRRGNFEPEYYGRPGGYPGYNAYPPVYFRPYIVLGGGYHHWR